MPDLAAALELLVPAANFRGSLTSNTQDAYDALVWNDSRAKPAYSDILVADADVQITNLKAFAADMRWRRQTGGFVYHGVLYSTDFQSPTAFVTAYAIATQNPNYSTKWKASDGSFVPLTSGDIIGLVESIQAFTDNCFAAEAQCASQVDDGTITNEDQIIAIINAVPNSV